MALQLNVKEHGSQDGTLLELACNPELLAPSVALEFGAFAERTIVRPLPIMEPVK